MKLLFLSLAPGKTRYRFPRSLESDNRRAKTGREHLDTATIWSAPAKRSGDGALAPRACLAALKAVSPESFRGCHRTPYIPHTTNWLVVARCTRAIHNPSIPHARARRLIPLNSTHVRNRAAAGRSV